MTRVRTREMRNIHELADLRQSIIPMETCTDVPPGEFDRWYYIVSTDPKFLVPKPGLRYSPEAMEILERMRSYIPEHVSQCDICQRRYEAKKHISAAFRSILGFEEKQETIM